MAKTKRDSSIYYFAKEKIIILYTYKCNARCAHCIVEADIEKEEKLEASFVKLIIDRARKAGKTLVSFSGGEVFLFLEELLELVQYANRLRYYVVANTNGFWARDSQSCYRILHELKKSGLDEICPSGDAFHAPYVPTGNIRNIIKICKDLKITCNINYYPTGREQEDREISEFLNLDTEGYYNDGLSSRGRITTPYQSAYEKKSIENLGEVYITDEYEGAKEFNEKYCSAIFTVTPCGDVIVNCDASYKNLEFLDTPFYLGNLFEVGIEEVFKREKENKFIRSLHSKHFHYFHELLSSDPVIGQQYKKEITPKKYINLTEYFIDILNNDLYKNRLNDLIGL